MPTCDERIVETFLQFQCGKSHAHETAEGSQTDQTGFYTLQFCTSNPSSLAPKTSFQLRFVMFQPCMRDKKKGACRIDQRRMWIASSQEVEELYAQDNG